MNFGRRPNRGGGKFNKSRSGMGGGSRKASGKAWDDGDDFSFAQKPTVPTRTRSRGKGKSEIRTSARSGPGTRFGVGSRRGSRTAVGGAAGTAYRKFADERMKDESEFNLFGNMVKSQSSKSNSQRGERLGSKSSDHRVLLQTINMTAENQKDVKQLLQELQNYEKEVAVQSDNSEEECDPKEEYDELDYRNEDQYWSTKEEGLAVAESVPLVRYPVKQQASFEQSEISPFAVRKLTRYGFHADHCKSALKMFDGDAGTSLEYLLQLCFREKFKDRIKASPRSGNIGLEDCVERRQEEALVLSSIFESKFSERIQNRVWTIELALAFLTQGLNKFQKCETEDVTVRTLNDVCQYYLKGGCRFGSRCKFRHDLPSKGEKKEDKHLRCDSNALLYTLEIRFPPNNKYPYEAPLLAFSTTNDFLPQACRLLITEHLYGEALLAAKTHEPVVHTLIMCLENEVKMNELLLETSHKYSVPPVPLALSIEQTNGEQTPRKYPLDQHLAVKAYTGAELEDDDLQEEEPEAVVMETESYVYLKKKQLKKYNWKLENVYRENQKLCKQFQAKQSSRQYQIMLHERKKLPAFRERDTILNLLNKAQVLVVSGMTGCGKTTQIPQFILDDSLNGSPAMVANIICTQPRRISAISVAERVAKERIERLGGSVGYQIRLESVKTSCTRLLYCTAGVLLRRLEADPDLQGVSHVIVDEVHERTEESDFLLLVLKDLIVARHDLRIILMSATLNAQLFTEYFNSCPSIHIPGHTFPVAQYFLEDALTMTRYVLEDKSPYARTGKLNQYAELWGAKGENNRKLLDSFEEQLRSLHLQDQSSIKDSIPDQHLDVNQLMIRYKGISKPVLKTMARMDLDKINLDLIEALLEWIVDGKHNYPPGAVLIFLPGLAEIKLLYEQLQCNPFFNNRRDKRCVIHPLHSSLSSEEQQAVFLRPPKGTTKIIISTNIAETSVTIDDVVYVIDSGKMKEKRYDPCKGMESLEDTWVSRANAQQRMGRAGRVASGICFHLFTSHWYHHHLQAQQLPEIKRVPLEQLCLRIKVLDIFADHDLESVLSRLVELPMEEGLNAAKNRLQDLGALKPDEKLTPLGYHLAFLPVDVRIGKLMLFGAIFRCLDPALTIAASLAFKSPFVSPWDKKEEAREKKLEFAVAHSDFLAFLQAYKGWSVALNMSSQAAYNYCRQNFLSGRILQEISSMKRQFAELLSDIGFVKEGLRARYIEKMSSRGGDGIIEATGQEANSNAENMKLISAILCAALYPNVVQVTTPQSKYAKTMSGTLKVLPKPEELHFITKNDGNVHIHPSSVNYQVRHFESPYLVYHEKVKTSRVFLRDCSMVSVYPLVLFGGGQVSVELERGQFIICLDDGWIRFAAASPQIAELVKELRWELDQLLEDKIKKPNMDLCTCPRGSLIIDMIVKLITTQ
ncbi:putative ATP-dependent RNA helicase DHX57 [Stegostoma tigrinum]|uniref:putative ATP-dependent RNA helicase DHX57 n=1 Tax=Stegostoma tigrinum TaxID=3053191 RepID=UPI00286FFF4D|nr:putative ATP-dependent RNA helicase DHX57 [Stegostoma tigrinum]XP_048392080.2 putative ATP-dependent RNA helicase DHX57 [Stegostoma tigrinum]XP_048392081.2 putative ATP-dependent RNA helicase DHX57 [Stegostoma tigrinum]XP_048392082.2 putative ATP-dependent RNA helicase DHX57 [Stegostoma tigrinum]XP_048392083.2 putative ATP-dependent RNA helicase DHX57 [Stegostoma tigrinum]XP_059504380.1 putative ATP-dependent RNA helicase DHX57 [Stegostoma tigrinum]XP_059504381.1 putative ATP-dependent RNA